MPKMISDDEREELLSTEPVRLDPEVYGGMSIEPLTDPLRIMQKAADDVQNERERQQLEQQNRERRERKQTLAQEAEALNEMKAEARELMAQEERERVVAELRGDYFRANTWATEKDFERALPALLDERGRQQMAQRDQAERASPVYSRLGSGF